MRNDGCVWTGTKKNITISIVCLTLLHKIRTRVGRLEISTDEATPFPAECIDIAARRDSWGDAVTPWSTTGAPGVPEQRWAFVVAHPPPVTLFDMVVDTGPQVPPMAPSHHTGHQYLQPDKFSVVGRRKENSFTGTHQKAHKWKQDAHESQAVSKCVKNESTKLLLYRDYLSDPISNLIEKS